jgi:hypothetical protein
MPINRSPTRAASAILTMGVKSGQLRFAIIRHRPGRAACLAWATYYETEMTYRHIHQTRQVYAPLGDEPLQLASDLDWAPSDIFLADLTGRADAYYADEATCRMCAYRKMHISPLVFWHRLASALPIDHINSRYAVGQVSMLAAYWRIWKSALQLRKVRY